MQRVRRLFLTLLGFLVWSADAGESGEDLSPREQVIVLAASHLGGCRGQILVGPAHASSVPSRSFWYMSLYQLLGETGRKTDGVSSAVMPMLGNQDLKEAGPDACVFLPHFAHPHGCDEWVQALEASQVSLALVADFLGSGSGKGISKCLEGWSQTRASQSRLTVAMNVTLTPLEVATAEESVRLQRSMLVALIKPRSSVQSPRMQVHTDAATDMQTQACETACRHIHTATSSGVLAGKAKDGHQRGAPQLHAASSRQAASDAPATAVTLLAVGAGVQACHDACVRTSHADPRIAASVAALTAAAAAASNTQHSKTLVRLPWYPDRPAVLDPWQSRMPHAKHLSWLEVETATLMSNTHALRRLITRRVKLCAVIKGNAFGHGLVPAARALADGGADWLAVDSLEEALVLRAADVTLPILILYWSNPWEAARMAEHNIQPSIFDETWVAAAAAALANSSNSSAVLNVHVAVDTGLGREGCVPSAAPELARAVAAAAAAGAALRVAGVSTHFCCPSDAAATNSHWAEVSRLHGAIAEMREGGGGGGEPARPMLHAASGAAAALYPHTHADMVRVGGLLFGILPAAGGVKQALASAGAVTQRAMRWLTTVVLVKELVAGACVGYECVARTKSGLVALLPLGSHDGFLEAAAGFRHVVIRGQLRQVLAVDSNLVIVDVSSDVKAGDTVVILGCDSHSKDVCAMPTLSTRIPTHLPRFYL